MMRNGDVSFWWDQVGLHAPRPSLPGDTQVDVAIVGAGYTGLWTAYYLKKAVPDIRIAVLESRFAGYGASGRNGGWLTNSVTGGLDQYVGTHGRQAAVNQQHAMNRSVDEVIRVASEENINADIRKGGELNVAYTPAQAQRLNASFTTQREWPGTDVVLLSAEESAARVGVRGTLAGIWHPHCARVHPAKLAVGLAAAVEASGVPIYEGTRVKYILPGRAETEHGTVHADHVIRATEGFTADLEGEHRTWLPMNSSMIITEPLPKEFWEEIGWSGYEALSDFAHVYMYAQRTEDDRIAFGGRGVPYRYGSRVDQDGRTDQATIQSLRNLLVRFFPAAHDVQVDHAWSGVLGVPRDWSASVQYDTRTGLGSAGGYVGTGVTTTNLAGRTLTDLILRRDTDLTRLPWTNHQARNWEFEPLRWLAVQTIYGAYRAADRNECRSGRPGTSALASIAGLISGR